MVSGLFRHDHLERDDPVDLRGRMAGIEQLSYMTGPLLGNARAGFMAERFGFARSITWGGLLCVAGVVLCVPACPRSGATARPVAESGRAADREPAENA